MASGERALPIFCGDVGSSIAGVMLWPDDMARAERFVAWHLGRGRSASEHPSALAAYLAGGREPTARICSGAL